MKRKTFVLFAVLIVVLTTIIVYSADAAGIPKKAISTVARFLESDLPTTTVFTDASNTFNSGLKQTFTSSSTTAGLNVAPTSGDPSSPSDGDVWLNSDVLKYRGSGATKTIITSAVTSINSDTTPAQVIQGQSGNTTVSTSAGTTTVNTGTNVVVTGGSAQRVNKILTLQEPQLNGFDMAYVAKTGAYATTVFDNVISVNATAGGDPTIITIPAASSDANKTLVIKKIDYGTNVVMIKPSSGTIDGYANYNITNAKESITLISDGGTDWNTLGIQPDDTYTYRIKGTTNNRWYGSADSTFTPTTVSASATALVAASFIVPHAMKIDSIQLEVTTTSAGSTCRMGIYTDSDIDVYPDKLVTGSDQATVSGANPTGVRTITYTTPITLQRGLYWLASECSSASVSLRATPITAFPPVLGVISTMGTAATATGYNSAIAYNAAGLPTNYPATASFTITPLPEILVRLIG